MSAREMSSVVLVVLLLALPTAASAASGWTLESTPRPLNTNVQGLTAVYCASSAACVALGDGHLPGSTVTVGENWNGRSWAIQSTPDPIEGPIVSQYHVGGVDCLSPHACFGVGSMVGSPYGPYPMLLSFDGVRWQSLAVPGVSKDYALLEGISCPTSRSCLAVGAVGPFVRSRSLAERWDGKNWNRLSVGHDGSEGLYSVSCNAPDACTAVGTPTRAEHRLGLAERWDGSRWTIQPTPRAQTTESSRLVSISCTSTQNCIAVGEYETDCCRRVPVAERWDGRRWNLLKTVAPPGSDSSGVFSSVACVAANACVAVGSSNQHPLVERWNGRRWTLQGLPPVPAGQAEYLYGVSCVSAVRCTAVGGLRASDVESPLAIGYS